MVVGSTPLNRTQQNVLEMLGKPLTSYPIAHHVDSIFSRMCHGINQVCVKGGQCLTAADAVDIIAAGDAEYVCLGDGCGCGCGWLDECSAICAVPLVHVQLYVVVEGT